MWVSAIQYPHFRSPSLDLQVEKIWAAQRGKGTAQLPVHCLLSAGLNYSRAAA